jgi:N6-adenosine-specific RNA methylase IME4
MSGNRQRAKGQHGDTELPYPTMTMEELLRLPVCQLADDDCHLWLWTTNQFLEDGFILMRAWGFKYLSPIHVVKPSGVGNYFVQLSQTMLFGYREKCKFPLRRYRPNVINVKQPARHSEKWDETYDYIESISPPSRLEMFARRKREGWDVWGNEIPNDIQLPADCLENTQCPT